MSKEELDWLTKTLKENQSKPTIIFYHAPLSDTLIPYNDKVGSPRNFAQPAGAIDLLLLTNPQVKLWVSGHTHTPPTQPSFNNEVNYYHGKSWMSTTPPGTANRYGPIPSISTGIKSSSRPGTTKGRMDGQNDEDHYVVVGMGHLQSGMLLDRVICAEASSC